ncbi:stage III sporulation protein AE [Ruminococcus sp. JL13D9]|uniref:stage III sporulation protein AE n=1 Tax=Ruminococcus sp. JL13D9 TaxID=3233381 RepID=UPI003899BCFB
MKKFLTIITVLIALLNISALTVSAEEYKYDFSEVYGSLSDEAREHMLSIGADSADANALSNLSFDNIMSEIEGVAADSSKSPLSGLISIIALLLICSMLSAYKSSLSPQIGETLNTASALCICCSVLPPSIGAVNTACDVIVNASNLLLAFVPIAGTLMVTSGQAFGSAAYCASVIAAGQGVAQTAQKIIVPFLNMFLGISISGGLSPGINLNGFTSFISKAFKWILAFVMTIFTSVLGIKQVLAGSLDNVSGRTVRFALSSFVPVVGSALSEAYRTVSGSVSLLKSGLGVFVVIAVGVTFLPIIINCLLWSLSLKTGKAAAEVMGLNQSAVLLDGIGSVFSVLIAVLLCIAAVFIISAAMIFLIGGGGV